MKPIQYHLRVRSVNYWIFDYYISGLNKGLLSESKCDLVETVKDPNAKDEDLI